MEGKQNKKLIYYLPWAGRCSAVWLQESSAPSHTRVTWEDKTVTLNVHGFLLSPPALYTEHDGLWYGISVWAVGVTCPSYVPSKLHHSALPAYLLAGWYEKQKRS